MGDVAMIILGIVLVGFPFLQLPPAPDLRLEQLVPQAGDVIAEFLVIAQHVGGLDRVGEQVVNDLLIVGHAFLSGPCSGDQPSGVTSVPSGRRFRWSSQNWQTSLSTG